MARNKGLAPVTANLQVNVAAALDPRMVVDTYAELKLKETWPYSGDDAFIYSGLVVAVTEDKALYMLIDATKYTLDEGWKRLDAGSSISDISDLQSQVGGISTNIESLQSLIDVINGDESTEGSVAKQIADVKSELSDTINNTIDTKLSAVYQYKGSKATFDELPSGDDVNVGDVYNVEAEHDGIAAGTNYAWNGTEWDALAGSVDLTDYIKTSDVESKISEAKTELEEKITDVSTNLNAELTSLKATVKDKLVVLNGDESTEGSVAHAVSTAISTLDSSVNDKLEIINASIGTLETKLETLLDTDESNEDSIAGKLKIINDAITTLDSSVNAAFTRHVNEEYTPLKTAVDEHTTKLSDLEKLLEWVEYNTVE